MSYTTALVNRFNCTETKEARDALMVEMRNHTPDGYIAYKYGNTWRLRFSDGRGNVIDCDGIELVFSTMENAIISAWSHAFDIDISPESVYTVEAIITKRAALNGYLEEIRTHALTDGFGSTLNINGRQVFVGVSSNNRCYYEIVNTTTVGKNNVIDELIKYGCGMRENKNKV